MSILNNNMQFVWDVKASGSEYHNDLYDNHPIVQEYCVDHRTLNDLLSPKCYDVS